MSYGNTPEKVLNMMVLIKRMGRMETGGSETGQRYTMTLGGVKKLLCGRFDEFCVIRSFEFEASPAKIY